MLRNRHLLIAIMAFMVLGTKSLAAPPIDYQRDVQPIFAEHCVQCHGIDQKHRKAKLRLDIREDALKGGSSGQPAIAPGQPDKSELFLRISIAIVSPQSPQPLHKRALTARLKDQQIEFGANGVNLLSSLHS